MPPVFLQYVMARVIDRAKIFRDNKDRKSFLDCLADILLITALLSLTLVLNGSSLRLFRGLGEYSYELYLVHMSSIFLYKEPKFNVVVTSLVFLVLSAVGTLILKQAVVVVLTGIGRSLVRLGLRKYERNSLRSF